MGCTGFLQTMRLGDLAMIPSNALEVHTEHERNFVESSTRSATRHWLIAWHIGWQHARYRGYAADMHWIWLLPICPCYNKAAYAVVLSDTLNSRHPLLLGA